jgi:ATP phosphoribosyltransferase-like protein
LKAPTVSELHHKMGFAVQIAAPAETVPVLIPRLHELGGSDIVVSSIKMLVA